MIPQDTNKQDIYSPYQIISLQHTNSPSSPVIVKASNLWFQNPYDLRKNISWATNYWITNYSAPYAVVSEIPKKILIVGSGTGNDVAYALQKGIQKIDAVEIDPVIIDIGKKYHPQSPYQSSKVNIIQNDARNFIQHTKEKYDLIIYGLLDSHTSLSGRGGIRLDSYVYTVDAFKEAKKILNEDGYISLSFYVATIELGAKIHLMLKEAFSGNKPIVLTHKNDPSQFSQGIYTFVIGKNVDKNFEISNPYLSEVIFFENKQKLLKVDKSTDDWPFFYMPAKVYPKSYIIIIFLILLSSFLFLKNVTPINKKKFSVSCFFLGAGFMLIETKGITELALVFGSTWFVVSIVIAFVLIMAYFANLLIIKNISIKTSSIYLFILLSIFFGFFFTFSDYGNLSSISLKILTPAILTVPIFFSGLAFSRELSFEKTVSVALSSNILGAMFGGLLEYNSMYFGFRSLYFIGFFMYLMAFIFSKKIKT